MSQSPIDLKGRNFTLSVVQLHHSQPDSIRQILLDKIKQSPDFWHNAPVVMNIANLPDDADLIALKDAIISTGLKLIGVSGCQSKQQQQKVANAGLAILNEGKSKTTKPLVSNNQHSMIINTPVRTGQQIYARQANLIVTGHISVGAELIADGNIHVYGAMRGRILAGASGDTQSRIFCSQFMAELVSIAGQYWLSEQIPTEYYEKSVQLYIEDNNLMINYLK